MLTCGVEPRSTQRPPGHMAFAALEHVTASDRGSLLARVLVERLCQREARWESGKKSRDSNGANGGAYEAAQASIDNWSTSKKKKAICAAADPRSIYPDGVRCCS